MILIALESLLKDLQMLFLSPRANSNYFDHYRAWKFVNEVSVVMQARYSAMLFSPMQFLWCYSANPCAIVRPRLQN